MKALVIGIDSFDIDSLFKYSKDLQQSLEQQHIKTAVLYFPDEKQSSAYFINKLKEQNFSKSLNPYAIGSFYSLHKFDNQQNIAELKESYKVIILINYASYPLVAASQTIPGEQQKINYWLWQLNYEKQVLRCLKPDHSFILQFDGKTVDDISYELLAETFKEEVTLMKPKVEDAKILADIIVQALNGNASPNQPKQASKMTSNPKKRTCSLLDLLRSHHLPEDISIAKDSISVASLNKNQTQIYNHGVEHLNSIRNKILKDTPSKHKKYIAELLSLLSTVVNYSGDKLTATVTKEGNFEHKLHESVTLSYSSGIKKGCETLDISPKNQMRIIDDILYAVTDLSYSQITEQTNKMPYDDKVNLITSYIQDNHTTGLNNVSYTFNIGTSLYHILWLKKALNKELITIQDPSPRNGYFVPSFAEKHYQLFEEYFDYLIELNAKLSNTEASRYLVAMANIVSAKIKLSHYDVRKLMKINKKPQIAEDIILQAKLSHPILYEK